MADNNLNQGFDKHPVPGSYLTMPSDVSVGQVAAKLAVAGHGQRGQSGAYERCVTYGGINPCFSLDD